MSDFDIFPTLDEPEAKTAVATAPAAAPVTTIKGAVLAQFKATEPVLRTLVARYADVAIDCSTSKGLATAKEARHDMRENGRFVVQRAEKAIKDEVNGLKSVIADEAERLIAIVQPIEKLYDDAIKAREAELAAEKAERERKEAERVAAHRANIAKIAGYVNQAQGRTSEQLVAMINGVAAIEIDPAAWEEFAVGAEIQKTETLEALQALFDRTKKAEDEAAAREAQRIENERKAAELAAKEAELNARLAAIAAAEKAEADRIAAEAKAQREAEEAVACQAADDEANARAQEAAAVEQAERIDLALTELVANGQDLSQDHPDQLSDDALAVRPEIADTLASVPAPAVAIADIEEVTARAWALPIQFADKPALAADEPASLTLGQINAMFGAGFSMTAAFISDVLGIKPAGTKKAAVLFRPPQITEIVDALVERCGEVASACEA